jgi:hypothetical protein
MKADNLPCSITIETFKKSQYCYMPLKHRNVSIRPEMLKSCISVAPGPSVLTSLINNVSFIAPPSPLLSQGPDIPNEIFCPIGRNGFPQCPASAVSEGYCECVHVIKVPYRSIVQIVIADLGE